MDIARSMKALLLGVALIALAACERQGPAEKAGREIDRAAQQAGKAIEQAGEDVQDAAKGRK